jgi:tRNA modification GTPase
MPSGEVDGDTIVAVATPSGRGGIGIVRLSGPQVATIARELIGRLPAERTATFCAFRDARGEPLDEGIALYFEAPRSFTGEPMLELQGHGGAIVMQSLLAACIDAGARLAEPGEFTKRAFLNGKLDLAQAEAVADLIDASSREAARSALRSLSGEFSSEVNASVARLVALRALVEAMLDFPEEDVEALHRETALRMLDEVTQAIRGTLAKSRSGSLLRGGVHVVIAGRPNVGKSSLLNRLAGEERAIVTPVAGTTRDALRESIQIGGVPLVLVDTAGLRPSEDIVERLGMERTELELAKADVVLEVLDASKPASRLQRLPSGAARITVYNKIDLLDDRQRGRLDSSALAVSATSGEGLDALRARILEAAGWSSSAGETVYLARERHVRALESAQQHLQAAGRELARWEMFAEELRLAQKALGLITGEVTADDLLGEIFGRFCIGK